MTKIINSDRIISAIEEADFLFGTNRRLVRFEKPNRFFNGNLKVAFFIGDRKMFDEKKYQREYMRKWRKTEKGQQYIKKFRESHPTYQTNYMREYNKRHPGYATENLKKHFAKYPWLKAYWCILSRCVYDKNSSHYKRGIKNFLKKEDLKFLWFRDKAYLMDRPSIDRINSKDNYTLDNCRYIELAENVKRIWKVK